MKGADYTTRRTFFYAQKKIIFPSTISTCFAIIFADFPLSLLVYLSRLVVIVRGDDDDDDEEEKNDCDWENEGKDGRIRFFNKLIDW